MQTSGPLFFLLQNGNHTQSSSTVRAVASSCVFVGIFLSHKGLDKKVKAVTLHVLRNHRSNRITQWVVLVCCVYMWGWGAFMPLLIG